MDEVIQALFALGGSGTTYQVTRHILGRDRQHWDHREDVDFLNEQDNVRTCLRRAYWMGRVNRSRGRAFSGVQWIYALPSSANGDADG